MLIHSKLFTFSVYIYFGKNREIKAEIFKELLKRLTSMLNLLFLQVSGNRQRLAKIMHAVDK